MPRRNENNVHDRGHPRHKRKHVKPAASIDWDHLSNPEASEETRSQRQARRREEYPNGFTRYIMGFSQEALRVMTGHGLEEIDETGFVAVRFTGVSQAIKRRMEYKKPSVIKSRGGVVILTGLVEAGNIDEIGHGSGSIRQADVPNLDTHTSPARLNVALGRASQSFNEVSLTRILAGDEGLFVSPVTHINDKPFSPVWQNPQRLWNTPGSF